MSNDVDRLTLASSEDLADALDFALSYSAVSYTHLTLPTNREV